MFGSSSGIDKLIGLDLGSLTGAINSILGGIVKDLILKNRSKKGQIFVTKLPEFLDSKNKFFKV